MSEKLRKQAPPQDNTRENYVRELMGLQDSGEGRGGADARDANGNKLELKTAFDKKKNTASVRSLGPDHIRKFRSRHWIFAYGKNFDNGTFELDEFYYVAPAGMESWISKLAEQLNSRNELSKKVIGVMSAILPAKELVLLKTIHTWGCKLNVPMIPYAYVKQHGVYMHAPFDKHLQELMAGVVPVSLVEPKDIDPFEAFYE